MYLIQYTSKYLALHLIFIKWLQGHLLPCPFKYMTGIDCPGCGFQRAVIALIQGDLEKSFLFYPPAIPLLIFFAYSLADRSFNLDTKKHSVRKTLYIVVGIIILTSYGIKLYHIGLYHKLSI